jgi:hypothetical protein
MPPGPAREPASGWAHALFGVYSPLVAKAVAAVGADADAPPLAIGDCFLAQRATAGTEEPLVIFGRLNATGRRVVQALLRTFCKHNH